MRTHMLSIAVVLTLVMTLTLGVALPSKPAHAQSGVDPSIIVALAEQARQDLRDIVREAAKLGAGAFKRSVVVTFENHTNLVLSKTGDRHSSGNFGKMLPHPRLNPGGITVFTSRSTGFMRGAIGWVEYWTPDSMFGVRIKWSNPWAGSNDCSAEAKGPFASQYVVYATCGGGNRGAMMDFKVYPR